MQIQNGNGCTLVSPNGKKEVINGIHPNFDKLVLDQNAPKMSVEYAKARDAINEDYKLNYGRNVALAKRIRRESKNVVIEVLGGKVSTKTETMSNGKSEKKVLITFPDNTVARI